MHFVDAGTPPGGRQTQKNSGNPIKIHMQNYKAGSFKLPALFVNSVFCIKISSAHLY